MALDGALLSQLRHEIFTVAAEARIDRIAQPYHDEVILHLRWPGGNKKLLLSASASNPRIHFTNHIPENPQNPPMFCMLLRKHLSGARLLQIRQEGMDRILYLDFEALNEFGDIVTLTLVHEIMGRHSNLILVDENGMILDAIKRAGFETSSVRQLLPNIRYHLPPEQDKLSLLSESVERIVKRIRASEDDTNLSRAVMNSIQGMSPMPSREVAYRALQDDTSISQLSEEQWAQVTRVLENLKNMLREQKGTPTILLEKDGRPLDFTFATMTQYGNELENQELSSYSELLDTFYYKRHRMDQMRQLSADLKRNVTNIHDRIVRRLSAQKEELLATKDREELKIKGDILTTNIYALTLGMKEATLQNFYDEDGSEITIALDSQLSPAENAQQYYAKYRKADTAEKVLTKQIESGKQELEYITSVQDALSRAGSASELEPIREELIEGGYLKKPSRRRRQKPPKVSFHEYQSSDGFRIRSGRNNRQNEELTLRLGQRHDLWFHTQNIPGSHTVISTERQTVPERTLLEAAMIAAYHSQARESNNVAVDFTELRNVRKQSGGNLGMVIYDNFSTLFVTPVEEEIQKLEIKRS